MSNKFDQLTKSVAQSVTRRQALKRFAGGLAAMALAGLSFNARAACLPSGTKCQDHPTDQNVSCARCCGGTFICDPDFNGGHNGGETSDHCFCQ